MLVKNKSLAVAFAIVLGLAAVALATGLNIPSFPVGVRILTGNTRPNTGVFLDRRLFFSFVGGSGDAGNSSSSSESTSTIGKDKIFVGWDAYSQTPVTSQIGVTFVDITALAAASLTPDSDYTTWPNGLSNMTCNIEAGNSHCVVPGFDNTNVPFAVTVKSDDQLQVRITSNQITQTAPVIMWRAITE